MRVRSAGSAPADEINPAVVEAMAEIGIDLSKEFPKPLTDDAVQAADVVITMGCGDACPVYPGKRYLDWELDDPAGQAVDEVRPIRDEIDRRVPAPARRTRTRTARLIEFADRRQSQPLLATDSRRTTIVPLDDCSYVTARRRARSRNSPPDLALLHREC